MEQVKAAFFDRDGTIIKDVGYLDSFDKIIFIEETLNLILYLQQQNYKIFVVTNQSGVARGYFDLEFVNKTHTYIKNLLLKQKINIYDYFVCPHHQDSNIVVNKNYLLNCNCRKPKPGLILAAANKYNINLTKSLMFGDKIIDINAGLAAGCKSFFIQEFFNILNQDRIKYYDSIFK